MTPASEITCQELVELVTDYLEDTLSAPERRRFEAHLLDCDDCPIYVDQMRMTIRHVGTLTREHITPPAKDELLRRFRDWKQQRPDRTD